VTTGKLDYSRQFAIQGDLAAMLGCAVDLVPMNDAPIELRTAIIAARRPLFERSFEGRIDFEARTMSLFADAIPRLQRQREQILRGPNREQREWRARTLVELYRRAARAVDRTLASRQE
jgi:hypothetical protein